MTRELRPRSSDPTYPARTLASLRDPLDEPEFYGLDVPGCGANAPLQAALTAHACKPNAPDDEYARRPPPRDSSGCRRTISAARVASCVWAAQGAQTRQASVRDADGRLRLAAADRLCLAAAACPGAPARNPMRRDARLENGHTAVPALTQWVLPGWQAASAPVSPEG